MEGAEVVKRREETQAALRLARLKAEGITVVAKREETQSALMCARLRAEGAAIVAQREAKQAALKLALLSIAADKLEVAIEQAEAELEEAKAADLERDAIAVAAITAASGGMAAQIAASIAVPEAPPPGIVVDEDGIPPAGFEWGGIF